MSQRPHSYETPTWKFDDKNDLDLVVYNDDGSQRELSCDELEIKRCKAYNKAMRFIGKFFSKKIDKPIAWNQFTVKQYDTTCSFCDENGNFTEQLYPVEISTEIETKSKTKYRVIINMDALRSDHQKGPKGPHVGYEIIRIGKLGTTDKKNMQPSCLHSSLHHPVLREWNSTNQQVSTAAFMLPLFLVEDEQTKEEISSMPGVYRWGITKLVPYLSTLVEKGLKSVLLFGVVSTLPKDENGSNADSTANPVIRALTLLRKEFPGLLIACDVCLCPYTSHGHCGILNADGTLDNEKSIARLAQIALSYAQAGAQIVAPSDMMDGRIGSIKQALRKAKLDSKTSVLSYAAKFCSSFYGPFRDAAKSAPSFGDRKCYQLPPGSRGLAKRAVERDIAEGADLIMVKPGLPYLDVVYETKTSFPNHPLFVYQVSGEYAMIYHAAKNNAVDLQKAVEETITAFRRAGADCIITYFTPLLLSWL